MKLVMLLSLMMFSQFSFAQVLDPERSLEVMKAIVKSFEKKDLTCKDSITTVKFKSSTMTAFTSIFPNYLDVTTVTVRDRQPVIQIVMKYQDSVIKADVSTNADNTIVERIHFVNDRITVLSTNVGTILNPVYKYEERITHVENFLCK